MAKVTTATGLYVIVIPDYQPPRPNQLFRGKMRQRMRMEREAKDLVWAYGRGVPVAKGSRRVSMTITLGPRQREPDADGDPWKVILDALVANGLLLGDRRCYCELVPVWYERGPERATSLTLEDL